MIFWWVGLDFSPQVGTEAAPFQHKANITMYGDNSDPEIPMYGNKVIAVRYGTLDMHGKPVSPSWTRLDATAAVGDTHLTLSEEVGWAVGDRIAIASSDFDMNHAEEVVITAVDSDLMGVEFTPALVYSHYGEIETYGGRTMDMRTEVGLLSRNVIVQGDWDSQRMQHGAHIMLSSPGNNSLTGRFSNVECRFCGQAFKLGRYPIHFHMIGEVHASYVSNCSVHDTFNRAVTIHGVHYFRVKHNVVKNTMGHSIFIEDGIETENVIEHNLVMQTRSSASLLKTDVTPASFWMTNPSNYWIDNAAAGSERYGFWVQVAAHPDGPSATTSVCPVGMPLGAFRGNSAHSNGRYGLRIFNQYFPRTHPCQRVTTEPADVAANPQVRLLACAGRSGLTRTLPLP